MLALRLSIALDPALLMARFVTNRQRKTALRVPNGSGLRKPAAWRMRLSATQLMAFDHDGRAWWRRYVVGFERDAIDGSARILDVKSGSLKGDALLADR